ncbi:hypothetical protein [Kingella oralis]|uniref:hypothetical protein n=1 Tax=Kingella oralis TaxID=505 RepID=UPI0034E3D884
MSEIVKTLLTASVSIFNRKNIKKFFAGEIEISEDELSKISGFLLETRNKPENQENEILIQEIEQQKIPYLKELSIEELSFLREIGVRLEELKQIIFAKGGLLKGLAAIQWDNQEKKYIRKGNMVSSIFITFTTVFILMRGFILDAIIKSEAIKMIFLFLIAIFFAVNVISFILSSNMQDAVNSLQKNNKFDNIIIGRVVNSFKIFKLLAIYFIFCVLMYASCFLNLNEKMEFLSKVVSRFINYWLIFFCMTGIVLGLFCVYKNKFLHITKNIFSKIWLYFKNNLVKLFQLMVLFLLIFINFRTHRTIFNYFGFLWISFMFTKNIINIIKNED